jgi:hypothetical protein
VLFLLCSGLAIWCFSQGAVVLGSINAAGSVVNAICVGICIGARA